LLDSEDEGEATEGMLRAWPEKPALPGGWGAATTWKVGALEEGGAAWTARFAPFVETVGCGGRCEAHDEGGAKLEYSHWRPCLRQRLHLRSARKQVAVKELEFGLSSG
jgi:hypothetical protein